MKAALYFLGGLAWMVPAGVLLLIAAGLLALEHAIANAPVIPNEPENPTP